MKRKRALGYWALMALATLGPGGCANHKDAATANAATAAQHRRAELEALAHDYRYKAVDEAESSAMRAKIRALPPEDARAFHAIMRESGPPVTELQRRVSDAAFEYAMAHGKSPIDLTDEDMAAVYASVAVDAAVQ
jgi:hypothetical protein